MILSIIKTPLPAANPSALRTNGGVIVSKKSNPFCIDLESNSEYLAVGILWRFINSLAKTLLPSSLEAFLLGPITLT